MKIEVKIFLVLLLLLFALNLSKPYQLYPKRTDDI